MSKPSDEPVKPDANKETSNAQINSPEVGKDGKPTQRAISSAKQAHAIAKNLKQRAIEGRLKTAAVILDKYNGANPFSPSELSAAGQDWRSNYSTNFLASIIDRVMPQLLDPITKTDLLTHATLPADSENGATKARKFCEIITKTIRRWPSWRDFAGRLAQEVLLFGNSVALWLDDGWRPGLWKFDEFYMPEGTGQHAGKVQVGVAIQRMLLHEFMDLLKDKGIAEKAGYNFENCITAANNSMTSARSKEPTEVELQDAVREGVSMAHTYDGAQTRTVDLFHVIVRDYTGEVDLWTVSQDNGDEIRSVEGLHEDMTEALTLFTFQNGNGKFYGSKGLGRLLTNLHIAVERGRCLASDQLYLSGIIIFKADKAKVPQIQFRVRHPFAFVEQDVEVITEQIEFNAQNFEMIDNKLTMLAESIAGAFIPPNIEQGGSANTKIEAAQKAERELAVKEGTLGRFFSHLADLVTTMQGKICSAINLREGKRAFDEKQAKKETGIKVLMRKVYKLLIKAFGASKIIAPETNEDIADEEAVSAIVQMLEAGLTIEEIATLANSPSAATAEDEGDAKDNITLQYIASNKVNPYIDQQQAAEMEANIALGEDRARQLIIPTDDPNIAAIATRQQRIEMSEIVDGIAMPVVGSDNHALHRQAMAPYMQNIIGGLGTAPTPAIVNTAGLAIQHYSDHLAQDTMTGDDQKKQEAAIIQSWNILLAGAQKVLATAAAQLPPGTDPASMPAPINGQPPAGMNTGNPPDKTLTEKEAADVVLRAKEAEQRDRELGLKEAQHDHQKNVDAVKLAQTSAQIVGTVAQQSMKQGEQQAAKDLANDGQ